MFKILYAIKARLKTRFIGGTHNCLYANLIYLPCHYYYMPQINGC